MSSFDNPPGLYGAEDGFTALNALPTGTQLKPLDASAASVVREGLIGGTAWSAKPLLFLIAFLLLMADSLIVLFINGAFSRFGRGPRIAAKTAAIVAIAAAAGLFLQPSDGRANDAKPGDDIAMKRLDKTHLAYVVTGEPDVDRISERGLEGLTEFLTYRTTLEPGPPVGLDITKDELAFYPDHLLADLGNGSDALDRGDQPHRRLHAQRRHGAVRHPRCQSAPSVTTATPSVRTANGCRRYSPISTYRRWSPCPAGHVLTKSFYLLSNFPGRYVDSPLWIEARQDSACDDRGQAGRHPRTACRRS